MKILIRGARVMDPASGLDAVADVAVAAGRIIAIQKIPGDFAPNKLIEGQGCILMPGLVD